MSDRKLLPTNKNRITIEARINKFPNESLKTLHDQLYCEVCSSVVDHLGLCVQSWLSGNLGKTALRLIEILPMYFDTSLKTSRMSDGTREDTTVSVQIEEIKRATRALPFVTKLSPVRTHKSHGDGWGVSLRCSACEEYDNCGKKQEPPVQVSSVHPTELACLQELLKRLQDRHGECAQAVAKKATVDAASATTVSPDTPNVL